MIAPVNNHSTFKQIQQFLKNNNINLHTEKISGIKQILPEEALTPNVNKKRQIEFSTGRFCAHKALSPKFKNTPILHSSRKCPIWPDGYCGSITHTDSYACAATAPQNKLLSIGIDLESIPRSISTNAYRWITNKEERYWIEATKNIDFYSKLVFSVKEAIFKLIYPLTKKFFSFDAVSINKPTNTNRFTAIINIEQDNLLFKKGTIIHGFYFYNNNWIFSIAYQKDITLK